jgi:hypothetical protein
MSDGSLGAEIERRSAEIRNWPSWAQPYNPPQPSPGSPTGNPLAHGDESTGTLNGAETQPTTGR